MICFPTLRFWYNAARMAQLSPSVPQEVKTTCSGLQARALAMVPRLRSTRSLA